MGISMGMRTVHMCMLHPHRIPISPREFITVLIPMEIPIPTVALMDMQNWLAS